MCWYVDTERELRLSRKALKVHEETDEKGFVFFAVESSDLLDMLNC